jgi:hypothetical protein
MPTMCDGSNLVNGKPKPVTLVATVAARKTAVHPSRHFEASNPAIATKPATIPIKLNTTWMKVKVVIPKIMMHPRQNASECYAARQPIAMPAIMSNPEIEVFDSHRMPIG